MNLIEDDFVKAEFSPCRTWRYALRRRWSHKPGPMLAFIMLNPSTADEDQDDPTIRRCIAFAKREPDIVGLVVGNLFAYRATLPDAMRASADPVGPDNDAHLIRIAAEGGGRVICGWGEHGSFRNRGIQVAQMLASHGVETLCLGKNAGGQPKHPLYVRGDKQFEVWP